jgi:hypothetical protein
MEFFGFVETFFFISLVITFVLIMMLIYHFKERLTILEKKTNTMFDILTNIVNELNMIRNHSISNKYDNSMDMNILKNSEVPVSNIFSQLSEAYETTKNVEKIIVSEDDEAEDDSDEDISEDDESNTSDYDELNDSQQNNTNKIKIINVDLNVDNEEDVISEDESLFNSVTDFEAYSNMEKPNEENNENFEISNSPSTQENIMNELKIEKINKINEENNSYRKMDINALRNLVVERGITNDIKKLKKIELIKLLESSV